MLSEKQISCLGNLLREIAEYDTNEEIKEWYESQPENNTLYPDENATYRNQILTDKIKNADYYLVSNLIGDLKKVVYEEEYTQEFVENIIEKLNLLK